MRIKSRGNQSHQKKNTQLDYFRHMYTGVVFIHALFYVVWSCLTLWPGTCTPPRHLLLPPWSRSCLGGWAGSVWGWRHSWHQGRQYRLPVKVKEKVGEEVREMFYECYRCGGCGGLCVIAALIQSRICTSTSTCGHNALPLLGLILKSY